MSRVQAALDRLRVVAPSIPGLKSPYPLEEPRFGVGCCQPEIDELLGELRGHLQEYAEYLSLCRSITAPDVFCGYYLYSPLSIVGRNDSQPRFLHVERHGTLSEVRVFPVGGDGGGNLFVMGTTHDAAGVVWKWDHESVVRFDGMAKEGLTHIADSFAEFLERVATDWEHFVAADRDWRYVSG